MCRRQEYNSKTILDILDIEIQSDTAAPCDKIVQLYILLLYTNNDKQPW